MITTNEITVTNDEIEVFAKLSHTDVLALTNEMKMKYLYSLQVKHKKLERVASDLMELISPFNETKILFVIGATGVGKTTLSKRVIRVLVENLEKKGGNDPSTVPFIFMPAPANGEKSLSWISIYETALIQSNEILINKKQANIIKNGIMSVQPKRYKNLPALRDALDSMLKNRKVRVLAIDEAYHLLRFGDKSAVMDTLKSIVDNNPVKLILLGSYDLFDLASDYAQVSRRAEILHFERYHIEIAKDLQTFKSVVCKIQQNWPCQDIPGFDRISKELMQATLGCIGLLKALMLRALSMQLKNNGKWDPKYLTKAAKSLKLIESIKSETESGEAKVAGATYGESIFSGRLLERVINKMNANVTDE